MLRARLSRGSVRGSESEPQSHYSLQSTDRFSVGPDNNHGQDVSTEQASTLDRRPAVSNDANVM